MKKSSEQAMEIYFELRLNVDEPQDDTTCKVKLNMDDWDEI